MRTWFTPISSQFNKKVVDIACSSNSLFLTTDDELYGCGLNDRAQLFIEANDDLILNPILITKGRKIVSMHVTHGKSLVLCGERPKDINDVKITFV